MRAYPARPRQEAASGSAEKRFLKQQWPGLDGYTVLQPNVAYGFRPTTVGLRWLRDRGFVTVLDLSPEPDPAEGPMCRQLGLQYRNEAITPESVADEQLQQRLVDLLSHPRYRPLYVHDEDGKRFAAVWLIYRVRHGQVDEAVVRQELAAMGLKAEGPLWQAALRAVQSN